MNSETEVFLKPPEAASRLGVSTPRFYQMCAGGLVPHVRLGRSVRVPLPAFEAWLDDQVRAALSSVKGATHADAA